MLCGNAYQQLRIAVFLLAVIPALALIFIMITSYLPDAAYPSHAKVIIGIMTLINAFCGYFILRQYPQNIMRIRKYLENIAKGELPEKIDLIISFDDIKSIEDYLNMIVSELKSKIKSLERQLQISKSHIDIIKKQSEEIISAEQQRVMIQSLGTVCHHIGQPATVLRGYLHILKNQTKDEKELSSIDKCMVAVENIAEILEKLRLLSEYKTVPYRTFEENESHVTEDYILDIDQKK